MTEADLAKLEAMTEAEFANFVAELYWNDWVNSLGIAWIHTKLCWGGRGELSDDSCLTWTFFWLCLFSH
jgi:hypothetical protein